MHGHLISSKLAIGSLLALFGMPYCLDEMVKGVTVCACVLHIGSRSGSFSVSEVCAVHTYSNLCTYSHLCK